jgi:ABC-2 type transport system ATP-binding protein
MASIELRNVTVDLPIYGAHNMNLKGRVANFLARRETEIEVIRALNNVSLSIKDGDRIGIVGPNGAGKTTLLRVMAGILKPSQGEVTIQGSVVSMIDQGLGMDPQCSGIENIFRRGIFLNQSTQQMQSRVDDIIEFSGLGDRIRHPLYTYSSGMRARLAFSIATSVEPEILIIDEGIGAADEEFSIRASSRLDSFINNAGILILSSHSKELVQMWCTNSITLNQASIQDFQVKQK